MPLCTQLRRYFHRQALAELGRRWLESGPGLDNLSSKLGGEAIRICLHLGPRPLIEFSEQVASLDPHGNVFLEVLAALVPRGSTHAGKKD